MDKTGIYFANPIPEENDALIPLRDERRAMPLLRLSSPTDFRAVAVLTKVIRGGDRRRPRRTWALGVAAIMLVASVARKGTTIEASPYYVSRPTWQETMLASREKVNETGAELSGLNGLTDLWSQIGKAFPVECEWMIRDASGDAGTNWFRTRDSAAIEQRMILHSLEVLARDSPRGRQSAESLRQEFDRLLKAPPLSSDRRRLDFYVRVGQKTRARFLQECPKIVFTKRHHFGVPIAFSGYICHRYHSEWKYGGGIYVYDPQYPERDAREIFRRDDGIVFDMSTSYDAEKILFSWRSSGKEDSFHVYEINVDGSGLRRITEGRYHDVHPFYLPDGKIGFVSTRVEAFVLCQPVPASALYVMDPDGTNQRRIHYGTLSDHSPFVLDDGSILFTRYEYQDKNLFSLQSLWTINPDGTRLNLSYGNTITVPNTIWQAKSIPGTDRILCTLAPHHQNPVGAIGVLDRRLGLENPESLRNITPEIPYVPSVKARWQEGDVLYYWSYSDPYPISEDLFLVAYGGPNESGFKRYRICLLDASGNREFLYGDPDISCFNPIPLIPRSRPNVLPGIVASDDGKTGAFFLSDVYQGLIGVERGSVKELRIMSPVPKPMNMNGQRAFDHDPIIGRGTYYVKSCLGTVPVYENGSAYFKAPSGIELYFSALDADGKELCRMGSITQIMPGETQSCIGCHESRFTAPRNTPSAMETLQKGPVDVAPPPWGAGPVDFVTQVQPVFDKYCAFCHSGVDPMAGIDLSGDKTRYFNMAYDNLISRRLVHYEWLLATTASGNFRPLTTGSRVSALTQLIEKHHGGAKVDDEGRRRIYTWIEANVPYYSTYDHTRPGTPGSRDTWSDGTWFNDFLSVYKPKCESCHGDIRNEAIQNGRIFTWINLTHPEWSRVLNVHLAESAGGLGITKRMIGKRSPLFQDKNDSDYQIMLKAIREGKEALQSNPRMDMPGAKPSPSPKDYGRLFSEFSGP